MSVVGYFVVEKEPGDAVGSFNPDYRGIDRMPPFQMRPWGEDAVTYDYALPGWSGWSPRLWISLEKGVVRTVHGKRHYIIGDDRAVYEARGDRPTFESPDFESTFCRER